MLRFLVIAALCVSARPALAQSFQDCVPNQELLLFGPPPVTLPQPLLPAGPQARAAQARPAVSAVRRTLTGLRGGTAETPSGLQAAAVSSAPGDCPTLVRVQAWNDTGWSADRTQAVGTYDAGGRGRVFTGRVDFGSGPTDVFRETHTYGAAGAPVGLLVESDLNGAGVLVPLSRDTYTNDAAGRILALDADEWDGAAWQPIIRVVVAYGSATYAASFVTEERVDGVWTPSYRGTFTYTADGRRLVSTFETWAGNAWSLDTRETWTHAAGRAASLVREFSDGTGGIARQREVFGYAGTRLATVLSQADDGAGAWADERRQTFTYDAAGRLSRTLTEASAGPGTPLENSARETVTRTAAGLAGVLREFWDGAAWVPSDRVLDTRSGAGVLAERVFQTWDGAQWANSDRDLFRFGGTTAGEGGAPAAGAALRAPQPNPTAGRTTLAFTLDAAGPARLAVVDALGREVAVLFDGPAAAGETTVAFDASGLPPGVYAARLAAGGRIQTQRVTVVR